VNAQCKKRYLHLSGCAWRSRGCRYCWARGLHDVCGQFFNRLVLERCCKRSAPVVNPEFLAFKLEFSAVLLPSNFYNVILLPDRDTHNPDVHDDELFDHRFNLNYDQLFFDHKYDDLRFALLPGSRHG